MNLYQMDSEYHDSVNSVNSVNSNSAQYRETDSDHRFEAGDSVGGVARVRLMCSYGGKIEHRAHDNHFSYVGGDTHILAVDRNVRFPSMISKLSSFWGSSISFKYQLPDEDLDSLVSVTSDEDMENMMAEYDRLQKMGYRSSKLRIFVFSNMPDGTSSLGSKHENQFVDAVSVGPVGRGYAAHEMNSKDHNVYMVHSAPNSPMIDHSSIDSSASAPARINTSGSPHGSDHQAEMGRNSGRGFELNSNPPSDSRGPVPEIVAGKAPDHTANTCNLHRQERYPLEFSVINERAAPHHPQLQIPIQEFQKLQLRQPHDPTAWPVVDIGRRIASDPTVRAVNFSNPDMTYMQAQQQGPGPSLSDYYMNDPGSHLFPQSYWQMHEPHGGQQSKYHPVYFVQEGSPTLQPMAPNVGQPATGGGSGGRYYNPGQRLTAPMQIYSTEAVPVTTVRAAATVQKQAAGLDPTDSYIEHSQIYPPVPKGQYTAVPSGPVTSDGRVVYRPTAPVPLVHAEPYSYENVGSYEASSGQMYYTQAPQVMDAP